ncbi:MAG TPA: hypothetical protein GX506_05750 [Firmicutes bacterium]|nr:hypothetical protein [Bacillota bacterium]
MPAGQRYELVEGDIRMTPSPTVSNQRISKRLLLALVEWIEGRGLGVVYNAPKDGELATQQVYPIGTTLTSPLLPGFALDVEAVFR